VSGVDEGNGGGGSEVKNKDLRRVNRDV